MDNLKEKVKNQLKLSEEEFNQLFIKTSPYVTQRELDSLAKSLATKEDLANLKSELKEDIANVKEDLANVKSELKEDIANVKEDLANVKGELKEDIADVKEGLDKLELRLTNKLYKIAFIISGILGALMTIYKFLG